MISMSQEVKNQPAVVVYSGGLDTSICIPFARENYGYQRLATVTVDVGQPHADLVEAATKARALGTEHHTIDAKEEFAAEYCFRALKTNALYQGYPLSTSIARPLIAKAAVEVGKRIGATAYIHGCTGKGNDQFRIEFGIRSADPNATIHAPIREHNMTRSWEIEYGLSRGVPLQQSLEKIWSIDENLWGRSIEGGRLEEPDFAAPESIFRWTRSLDAAPSQPETINLEFNQGIPVRLNGESLSPLRLILAMNELAGNHGVGRIDIIEDRMLGLKVRENYECPGAMTLIGAHKSLESLVLTKEELQFKAIVEQQWADLAYRGLWNDPLMLALNAFVDQTQTRVTGSVRMRLFKGSWQVLGRSSPWSLCDTGLASFDTQQFDQRESTGTVKHFGLQAQMVHALSHQLKGP
jgi:argininosuccinate synthase